MMETDRL